MNKTVAIIAVIALCLFMVGFIVFMWRLAKRRGFNPWCWFLSGLIGLLVLPFLQSPKDAESPEQAKQRARRGNIIGLLLTGSIVLLKLAAKYVKHFGTQ